MRELNDMVRQICEEVLDVYSEDFSDLNTAIDLGLRIGYCLSDKEKTSRGRRILGECQKVPEEWLGFAPYDFLITFYEPNLAGKTQEQLTALAYHELMHAGAQVDEDGTIRLSITPHDQEDFRRVLDRFGSNWSR